MSLDTHLSAVHPSLAAPTVVALVGSRYLAAALADRLPPGYRVAPVQHLDAAPRADAVVLAAATPALVAAAVRHHPGTPVVAVIDAGAPVRMLVGVLEAGADTCVRAGETALLAGHLLACVRRRTQLAR